MKSIISKFNSSNHQGAALVSTLLIISLLSIIVLTYLSLMSVERQSSQSFSDTQRTKMVAQGAVAHAIEILRTEIPEPAAIHESATSARGENWSINPGRLALFDDQGNEEFIDLHTGAADIDPLQTSDPDVHSVDLNEPIPGKTEPSICYALNDRGEPDSSADPPEMRVKWVNTLSDPSVAAAEENQIVARHAFWIDDESAKINFNTSYGKPSPGSDVDGFHEQFQRGMMPAVFRQERNENVGTTGNRSGRRPWGLGKLRSVNLDVLFDDEDDIDREGLLGNVFFRGFSRYPEALLDYVTLSEDEKNQWWNENRYHAGFYSRSPEFNAFGRPRFMTTNIPLSLEGGPLYQLPFVYNGPEAPDTLQELRGVLHLHSLLGSFGFTDSITEADGTVVSAGNIMNRAQLEVLQRYFRRVFPGYQGSFVDKYGEVECAQMALNILNMARYATSGMGSGINNFSRDHAWRTTSVLYRPSSDERPGETPERFFWRYEPGSGGAVGRFLAEAEPSTDNTVNMIAQSPGPHITEVRLILSRVPHEDDDTKMYLGVKFEAEYYLEGFGSDLALSYSPFHVDFLELKVDGPDGSFTQKIANSNWNAGADRQNRSLQINPTVNIEAFEQDQLLQGETPFRRLVSGNQKLLSETINLLAINTGEAQEFDINADYSFEIKFRGGMSTSQARGRPKQMIPMGIGEEDDQVLLAEVDMAIGQTDASISWQIADPRLSHDKSMWSVMTASDLTAGTPGLPNTNLVGSSATEPVESSNEKSKFRYVQRGVGNTIINGENFPLNRPDEFNSQSRVSSKGFWSMIHTGMHSQAPYRTIRLSPAASGDPSGPPDWLLMDLFGNTYPLQHDQWTINRSLPDEFSTISFMNSTAGAINLNSRTYPEGDYFEAPIRKKPHEAVFKHLRSDIEIDTLVDGIADYQQSDFFKYVGELSEVDGYLRSSSSATQFQNEELLRNMIGCLTTKSNTFGVWGVGQTVQKSRANTEWGEFEDGDIVRGEKRFYAVVERYIWAGKDGVPGNAHVNEQGVWDRHATQGETVFSGVGDRLYLLPGSPPSRSFINGSGNQAIGLDEDGTYPIFDGPQEVELDRFASATLGNVEWQESSLEDAYNPPQPLIKYRVVYFKFLDE